MVEENINEEKNIEQNEIEKNRKEQFDEILEKIKKMSEAIELHDNVKKAVLKNEIDYNYLRYIENTLEDRLLNNIKIEGIMPKILLEVICPDLVNIEQFDEKKLQIESIGSHFEEQINYIDKVCIYGDKLISVFGINEMHPNQVVKYEPRKFSRVDMIEAIKAQYKEGQTVELYQYDEYYIGIEKDRIKVFTERQITALVKVEETIFDKIKSKILNMFTKKKYCPNLQLVYDSNPNRLKDFENKSKFEAMNRMKVLLNNEREITRI